MRFQYQALHDDGRLVSGLIEAPSERVAHRDLLKRGVHPTAIAAAAPRPGLTLRQRRGLAPRNHTMILKQLSTLLEGGVPIAEAATALAEATDHPALAAAYASLNAGLRRGETFPAAFAACFPTIPEHIHRMIAAGDLSGRLAEALADAAAETEHAAKIRTELRQALVYPAFLVGFGCLAVIFIFLVVVPRFAAIFRGKFDKLPLLSYLVIAFGMWFRENLALALALLVGAALVAGYGLTRPRTREVMRDLLSRLPILRGWLHDVEIARWAAVLARLLENRVPLIQSLELARGVLRGRTMQSHLGQVERDVRSGTALATALDRSAFLAGPALTLIRVGERSGNLAGMVRSIAGMYDEAVRNRTRVALSIIEPLAIILIGGVIGLIATAIFLAITSINQVPGL
jgi:general secretion pathway protein F